MSLSINGDGSLSGVTAIGDVSSTELGYVDGVTSAIQGQLDDKALVFLSSHSATAGADITADNVFTSTYNFYKFVLTGLTSTDTDIRFVFRTSAPADVTGSNYRGNFTRFDSSTTIVEGTTAYFHLTSMRTATRGFTEFSLIEPNIAASTGFLSHSIDPWATTFTQRLHAGVHTLATAYAGIRVYPASGTITGSLYVYGQRHA